MIHNCACQRKLLTLIFEWLKFAQSSCFVQPCSVPGLDTAKHFSERYFSVFINEALELRWNLSCLKIALQ